MGRKEHYESFPLIPLGGGINDNRHPTLIGPSQSPRAVNIEFDRDSLKSTDGSYKFGNREAPHSCPRFKAPEELPHLQAAPGVSVPLRGYGYFPYSEDYDIGGRPSLTDDGGSPPNTLFHWARGQTFEFSFSFRFDEADAIYRPVNGADSGPVNHPDEGDVDLVQEIGSYGITLDECTMLLQKGGDRVTPMSWGFGIVDTANKYELMTGKDVTEPSALFPVFMWLDAPAWSWPGTNVMRYSTASSVDVENDGTYATGALRAITAEKGIRPGVRYHVAVSLRLDSGTPGSPGIITSWNNNGVFAITISEDEGDPVRYTSGNGLSVYKGPTDSLDYLERYGVRYYGRDAIFAGLGARQIPLSPEGNVVFGADAAALEQGGHKMIDFSVTSAPPNATLTAGFPTGLGFDYLNFNHRYLTTGNSATGGSPVGRSGATFSGLQFNAEALRNYWCILYALSEGDEYNGARFRLEDYFEASGQFRVNVSAGAIGGGFGNRACGIVPFRWRQRAFSMEGLIFRNNAIDYTTTARHGFTLRSHVALDDETDNDKDSIEAYWPMTDAEGGALKEVVAGRTGYLFPFTVGREQTGGVALSGEGEALCLDFSENPILERHIRKLLQVEERGFAIEVTLTMPEAYYGFDSALADGSYEAKYAPDLMTWEVKDTTPSGYAHTPNPMFRLTHRARWTQQGFFGVDAPLRYPLGFHARYHAESDQEDFPEEEVFPYWIAPDDFAFDTDAPWVGRKITLQIGLEPSEETPNMFDVYLAGFPKGSLKQEEGDAPNTEVQYVKTGVSVSPKEVVRSVLVIGGAWHPRAHGYSEVNARMIVHEIRVNGAPVPGFLTSVTGYGVKVDRGKIVNETSRAEVESGDDLLVSIGDGVTTASVTGDSLTATATSGTAFYTGDPTQSVYSVKGTYVLFSGDVEFVQTESPLPEAYRDFYRVTDSTASTLTLSETYRSTTRGEASVRAFRMLAYTGLSDRIEDREITLGRGKSYRTTTTAEDAILTDELWSNPSPTAVNWRMRIFSSLGGVTANDVIPSWGRGTKTPRKNSILGLRQKRGTLYAAVQGAIYEADDRWRNDGPSDLLPSSLAFRAQKLDDDVYVGEATDYALLRSAAATMDIPNELGDWLYEAWVKPSRLRHVQTILWIGNLDERLRNPGQLWMRLNDGIPELGIGSLSTKTIGHGDGDYVFAVTDRSVPVDEWTHIRWVLRHSDGNPGLHILPPELFINGRGVTTRVLTSPSPMDGAWVSVSDVPLRGDDPALVIGAAHVTQDVDADYLDHVHGGESGLAQRPGRYAGFITTFNGQIAGVGHDTGTLRVGNFNPYLETSDYKVHIKCDEGVGHIVATSGVPCILQSHALISRRHDLGGASETYSFASFQNKMYMANGGRVVYVDDDEARFAGVRNPTTKPTATLERVPLLKPNISNGTPNGFNNGPIRRTNLDEDERSLVHFNSQGNNYLVQNFHDEMSWEYDESSGDFGIFAFKCYVRLRSASGRIPLYSNRGSIESGGPFVEVRDGRVYFGWYDVLMKQEVWVRTSQPVIRPGFVYYIYIRKRFPRQVGWVGAAPGAGASNWENSVYLLTTDTGDLFIVKRFPREQELTNDSDFDALRPLQSTTLRNAIGFTTNDVTRPVGTSAAGLVSDPAITYSQQLAPDNEDEVLASGPVFHPNMVGMYFQFGDNAGDFSGKIYRIEGTFGNTRATMREDGPSTVIPTFITGNLPAGSRGGVFTGIVLEKSPGFDSSERPDPGVYNIELFGSSLASDPANGVARFNGEYWSFAYYMAQHTGSEDVDIFESARTDRIETGTDLFPEFLWNHLYPSSAGPGPGELGADGGKVFTEVFCTDTVDGSGHFNTPKPFPVDIPIPNEQRSVSPGSASSANSDTLFWQFLDPPAASPGSTKISVTFFDSDQNVQSNPGPELIVDPRQEDITNSTGEFRFLLEDLPISRDDGPIQRWIYASLPGFDTKFLTAQVPDNTSSSVVITPTVQNLATGGRTLEFTNSPPPRCKVLGVSQSSLWFANLTGRFSLEDGLMFSKPFFPAQVPGGNLVPLISDGTGEITAMSELKGRMIIYKSDALYRITLEASFPLAELVTTGVGCVARDSLRVLDDRHYFVSDRGPCVYVGQGLPAWIAHNVEELYTESLDEARASQASGGINRRRNQYVATVVEDGRELVGQRVSTEYDSESSGAAAGVRTPARYRFGRYEDPRCTVLGNVQPVNGSVQRLVGGTDDGFVIWLDHPRTTGVMRGTGVNWGARTGTVLTGSSTTSIMVDWDRGEEPDPNLAGVRGQPARFCVDGSEVVSAALVTGAGSLFLDYPLDAAPAAGVRLSVGAQRHSWESGWVHMNLPHQEKQIKWIDLITNAELLGSLTLSVFEDFDETEATYTETIDLTTGKPRFEASSSCGQHFKFKIESLCPAEPVEFEITMIIVRYQVQDQT